MNSVVLWYDIGRQGATNESMAENPTLKDLSGNGNDAICYNFGWSGMSGIGGYGITDLSSWILVNATVLGDNKLEIEGNARQNIRITITRNASLRLSVTGASESNVLSIYFRTEILREITSNGVYDFEFTYDNSLNNIIEIGCLETITIEQLPIYPNALVSDGVDDYATVSGLPIQNWNVGYTVIAKRKNMGYVKNSCLFSKRLIGVGAGDASGAFQVERILETGSNYPNVCFSYGGRTTFEQFESSDFIYQTSKSYCGHPLTTSSAPDSDTLSIFKWAAQNYGVPPGKYALYSLLLFNRDLTDEEIQWVKNNLMQ